MRLAIAVFALWAVAAVGPLAQPAARILSSPAFADYGLLPLKYAPSAAGQTVLNAVSPPLEWSSPPPRTQALVLTMTDLEAAPGGDPEGQLLWAVINLPPVVQALVEGIPRGHTAMLPEGAFQRSFLTNGYLGPQPGAAGQRRHYLFELHVLDHTLDVPRDVTLSQLKAAMKGHETGDPRVLVAVCCAGSR